MTAITHKKSDNSTFLSISYEQDKLGNPTMATENNGDVTDYTYDDLYRLTRETKEDSGEQTLYDYSYTYDAVGNRTKKRDEVAQSDTDYTYNNMNQMTAAGNIAYTYDDAANMASKTVNQETTNYTWDFRDKMLKVDFPTGDDPVMRYDGGGRRVKKVVGATTTKFLYARGGVAFETDGSDSEVAEYRRGVRGGLIAIQRSSALYWYHFDAAGSARALTDASQNVTDTYAYDAFGVVTGSSGSTANPFGFVGRGGMYTDSDVGLGLDHGRPYDPAHASVPASVGFEDCDEQQKKALEEALKWACDDEQTECIADSFRDGYVEACENVTIICREVGDDDCISKKGGKRCGASRENAQEIIMCFPIGRKGCPSPRCLLLHELVHIGHPGGGDEDVAEQCEDECCPEGEST